MSKNLKDQDRSRILLVDDNQENLEVLSILLEKEGYEISAVLSGEQALELVTRSTPDLILLDIMMPGLDGFEVCERLKNNPNTKDIPVIFITAKSDSDDIIKGFELGGVDYITKPFQYEVVAARIRTHLEMSRLSSLKEFMITELGKKNQHLIQLDQAKNKILSMAAHDLRNPLASIRGLSKILLKGINNLSPEELNEFLTIINDSSNHMLNLVNDLLDYSVIESGHVDLRLKVGSLAELIQRRIRINEIIFESKMIKIVSDVGMDCEFKFDEGRISQVIDNLLTNAAKFSNPGSSIFVKLEKIDDHAKVSVRDEGPGISKEDQKKIFDGFQRLNPRPTAGEKSTGLGLAIVKKILQSHGGYMEIDSELGHGSTFSFFLPMN